MRTSIVNNMVDNMHLVAPTPLEQAVRRRHKDRYAPTYEAHVHTGKSFRVACARRTREPVAQEQKKLILAAEILRGDMFRAVLSARPLAQPARPVSACDIRMPPYWHVGSCQHVLAIYRVGSRTLRPVLLSWFVSIDLRVGYMAGLPLSRTRNAYHLT